MDVVVHVVVVVVRYFCQLNQLPDHVSCMQYMHHVVQTYNTTPSTKLGCSGRACARGKLIYSNVHKLCGGSCGLYLLDGGGD